MGTTAMSSNLSMTRPTTGITPNVGYGSGKKTETVSQKAQAAEKQEDILVLDVTQEFRDEIKAKVAELDVPNILEIVPKPATSSETVWTSRQTCVGYDGSVFESKYYTNYVTHEQYNSNYIEMLIRKASGNKDQYFFEYFQNMAADIVSCFSTASTYKNVKRNGKV